MWKKLVGIIIIAAMHQNDALLNLIAKIFILINILSPIFFLKNTVEVVGEKINVSLGIYYLCQYQKYTLIIR